MIVTKTTNEQNETNENILHKTVRLLQLLTLTGSRSDITRIPFERFDVAPVRQKAIRNINKIIFVITIITIINTIIFVIIVSYFYTGTCLLDDR